MQSIKELFDALKLNKYPERWAKIYKQVYHEYRKNGCCYTDLEYLKSLDAKYRVFNRSLDDVLEAAKKLNSTSEYVMLSYLISFAMQERQLFKQELKNFSEINNQIEFLDTVLFNTALLFSVFPHISTTAKLLGERDLPEDIFYMTLSGFEDAMLAHKSMYGFIGYDLINLSWIQLYIDARILRIGRLNFEMRDRLGDLAYIFKSTDDEYYIFSANFSIHRSGMILGLPGFEDESDSFKVSVSETRDYYEGYPVINDNLVSSAKTRLYKNQWRLALSPEDSLLSVHIPPGERLSTDACEGAYLRARKIFSCYYPEFNYKAFYCSSWLLSPQLKELLSENSNIILFQKKYMRFPVNSTGKEVLYFVFNNKFDDLKDLPERTALEKALKQYYLKGKYLYEVGGVFF